MSVDPSLALQGAIVTALKADSAINGYLEKRVYDRVVPGELVRLPYISMGPGQITNSDAECVDGSDVFQQIDVWSEEPGYTQCKAISQAVKEALHRLEATADGYTFEIEHQFTNYNRAPDGLTSHGIISVKALIDAEA